MPVSQKSSADRIAPWVVLGVFFGLTALATKYVWDSSQIAERARFDRTVQTTSDLIAGRVDAHINVLRAATGLFAASEDVTRDQFRAYVRQLELGKRHPGMQGIGISVRVAREHVQDVVTDLRLNDFAGFHIWPSGAREEYHAIVVLEPLDDRNRAALGFDMFTDPTRRVAMEHARDTGEPSATGPLTLVREIDARRHAGFLIYMPIYTPEPPPLSEEERRRTLYGFVYAPFRARDLFGAILSGRRPAIDVVVHDGDRLLYGEERTSRTAGARFTATRHLGVAGRDWTLDFSSSATPQRFSRLTLATLAGGLLVSILLFLLIRVQLRARSAAEEVAEALRRSEAELQAASRAKDEFLATLSHELRTPMTAILGWSKLLAAGDLDAETQVVATEAIQKSSTAQAQLIDDLLEVSRITAGKMHIEMRPLDLAPIMRTAVDAITPAAEAKGVIVSVDIPAGSVHVNGDPQRIQQVIWNLLSNAVKFTPRGGRVGVALTTDQEQAAITVSDTGQGIDREFLPYVFDRFRQADSSTTRSYTGLGLGLAIVRHLIELHGGTVEADSGGPGQGARFTVRLPRIHAPVEADETAPREDRVTAAALRGKKILVVDDEDQVRNYVVAVFRVSGADVRAASSADEALDLAREWSPDIIISDLGMPEKDGFELLRAIRESAVDGLSGVPVVALTAYARPEDRERAELAGFNGFVAKPVDPKELRAAVGQTLR